MKKLNLGCGDFKKEGFVNLDINPHTHPDIVWDLDTYPYPFEDKTFDLIEADHVLEHVKDPFRTMHELHRILGNDKELIVRVPHFSRGFTHADHKRGFDVGFPFYFQRDFQGGYSGVEFKSSSVKLTWFSQPYLKRSVLGPISFYVGWTCGKIFDFFAQLSPFFCSRVWCFWVGGFEQVEFRFRAIHTSEGR